LARSEPERHIACAARHIQQLCPERGASQSIIASSKIRWMPKAHRVVHHVILLATLEKTHYEACFVALRHGFKTKWVVRSSVMSWHLRGLVAVIASNLQIQMANQRRDVDARLPEVETVRAGLVPSMHR
jgi:hypothetical protein